MSARPKRVRRGLCWTGVVLGLLVLYVASWPFVAFWCERNARTALPVVRAAYAPLEVYCRNEWPGSLTYNRYAGGCISALREHSRGDASARLTEQTSIQFAGTPLRDVIAYISEVHDVHIELHDQADGEVEITMTSSATLRDALDEMLRPLSLAAAPVGRKLVVGPPEMVQRLAAEAEAAAQASKLRGNLIVLGMLALIVTVVVRLVNRRAARRRAVVSVDAGNPDSG